MDKNREERLKEDKKKKIAMTSIFVLKTNKRRKKEHQSDCPLFSKTAILSMIQTMMDQMMRGKVVEIRRRKKKVTLKRKVRVWF